MRNSALTRQHTLGAHASLSGFPHRHTIEASFGRNLPGRAVVDPVACGHRGVQAFTDNDTTHFATERPSLKVASHEAVHVLQHTGKIRDANLGAEGQAAAAAQLVTTGKSPSFLLGRNGSAVANEVHNYTEYDVASQSPGKWKTGKNMRVADDGHMALAEESTANHRFWANPYLVADSNSKLTASKSVIRLKTLPDTLDGPAPNGGGARTLTRVIPENKSNGTSGDSMEIWADCGKCGRDVMGAGEGTGHGGMTAKYQDVHVPWYMYIPVLGPLLGLIFGGPTRRETQTSPTTDPKAMKYEIFNQKLGGTGDEGFKKYQAMSDAEKERFDKQTGINKYATPGVGQGYTMSTGGSPVPGNMTWNFHWAGVVMTSGDDRVTLENYSVSDPTVKNADWQFEMYGSAAKAGQTFFEQHKATGQHGDAPTALQVEKS